MARYDERIKGVENLSFEEAIANVKGDLRNQLIWIYFKDEPDFIKIIEDDAAYDKIFEDILDDAGIKESYAVHCRRRYVVRFCGVLYEFGDKFPPRIANRVAIELGVKHIAYHLKRSEDFPLTPLQRLKFYNKALKIEMMMLEEDLEWNDDLNDDMFNEIQRFERNVERERKENEELVLKGKARKAEIELLRYRLLKEFGVEPQKEDKPKKIKGKKGRAKSKQKRSGKHRGDQEEKCEGDEEEVEEKVSSVKSSVKRGFTTVMKE